MARRKKGPWKRKQDGCWYTTVGRTLHKLGEVDTPYEDVEAAYFELHRREKPVGTVTVGWLCDSFLEYAKKNNAPSTYEFYRGYISEFVDTVGHRVPVNRLTSDTVKNWSAGRYFECSQTVRHNAERAVVRAFNWAVKIPKMISSSPLAGIEKTQPVSRETYLTPQEYKLCLKHAREPFKSVLIFLWETGCRPQELRKLRSEWVDGSKIVFPALQSKGKRRRRVIYLNKTALEVVNRLKAEHPKGILFRNTKGKAYTKDALNCGFYRLRAKTEIKGLCAYSFRHGFATRLLKDGKDTTTVGILMGHANPGMVAKVYQHLAQDDDYLLSVINA